MTGFLMLIALSVAAFVLSGGSPKKIGAVIAGFCGFGLAYLFSHDSVEGAVGRPIGITIGIIAMMAYLEESKNQIVEALRPHSFDRTERDKLKTEIKNSFQPTDGPLKYETLPFYKWRLSLFGCVLLYFGIDGLKNDEIHDQSVFFICLSVYLLIMFTKIYVSSGEQLLSLEDLRLRKEILNRPKSMKERFVNEFLLISCFLILSYAYWRVDAGSELVFFLTLYIVYSFVNTINFNKEKNKDIEK